MEFIKYQHVERFGTTEVEKIELGNCYVFPKLDGTNASVWIDDYKVQSGSRRRHLNKDNKDNAGFMAWVNEQDNLKDFFNDYPNLRLFGEWLVPHTLKSYRDDAWNKFYVFDVTIDKVDAEILHEHDTKFKYLSYDYYSILLDKYNIDYVKPLSIVKNGNYEQFIGIMKSNTFLIKDGAGYGEGIVLKNYEFKNKFGRTTWAKIVTNEFKEKHVSVMGITEKNGSSIIEEKIAQDYVTSSLCEKVYSKIEVESGFTSKNIPQLLNTVYYDVVKEESWNIVKKFNHPKIDYSRLKHFVYAETKKHFPNIFQN